MGHRTVKRVPLDFDWPVNKVWKGYLNPHYEEAKDCPCCGKSGLAPMAKFLSDTWYKHLAEQMFGAWFGANIIALPHPERLERMGWPGSVAENIALARKFGFGTLTHWSDKLDERDIKALVKAGRLMDFTHTWTQGEGWKRKDPPYVPTPDEVNAWSANGMGHDSINQWVCVKARCRRYKIERVCPNCGGDGEIWPSPEAKKKAERWKPEEPPAGAGWQLWETVSEGSPISPVFATDGELAEWCEKNATIFGPEKLSKWQWLRLFRDKDELEVGSLMVSGDSGITSLAETKLGKASVKDWGPEVGG